MKNCPSFQQKKHKKAPPSSRRSEDSDVQTLFGLHAVKAALLNEKRVCQRLCLTQNAYNELAPILDPKKHPEPEILSRQKMDKILQADIVHQGCIGWFDSLECGSLDDFLMEAPEQCRLVMLDHVTDPHNVGAIMRSMAAFGADALIMHHRHSCPITGTLAKTAVGALEHIPVFYVRNLSNTMEILKEHGFQCLGLDERGEPMSMHQTSSARTTIIFGAEGKGLREKTRATCDALISIPTTDVLTSLNVSVAAAITLFCFHNQ